MSYKSDLYDAAVAGGYTPAQVRGMTYAQVASVCNVTLGPNGESPADFFYRALRRKVANRLVREAKEARQESRRQTVLAEIRQIQGFETATIRRTGDDTLEIRRNT